MAPSLLLLLLAAGPGAVRGFGVGFVPKGGVGVVPQHVQQHVASGFGASSRSGRDSDAGLVIMSSSQFNRDGGANEHMDKRDEHKEGDDPVVSFVHRVVVVVFLLLFCDGG